LGTEDESYKEAPIDEDAEIDRNCGIVVVQPFSLQYEFKKIPHCGFLTFFPKQLGILNQFFTHLLYDPLYTRMQIFIQLFPTITSYAILSATTRRIFTFHYNFNFYDCLLSKDVIGDVMPYSTCLLTL